MDHAHEPKQSQEALELKRKIDAICDRFEEDRKSGRGQGVEGYLASIDPAGREPLFRELVALDLALTPEPLTAKKREEYLARFPDFARTVEDLFSGLGGGRVGNSSRLDNGRGELRKAATYWANQTIGPAALPKSGAYQPAGEMWSALVARVRQAADEGSPYDSSRNDNSVLEAAAEQLIAAFPGPRRGIVRRLLLGATFDEVAQELGVTVRTVVSTYQTAIELLSAT